MGPKHIQLRFGWSASPGWMHETSAWTWYTGKTQRDRVKREVGGWIGMGIHVNPRLIHVNVWQKPLQYCKVISLKLIKKKKSKKIWLIKSLLIIQNLLKVSALQSPSWATPAKAHPTPCTGIITVFYHIPDFTFPKVLIVPVSPSSSVKCLLSIHHQ